MRIRMRAGAHGSMAELPFRSCAGGAVGREHALARVDAHLHLRVKLRVKLRVHMLVRGRLRLCVFSVLDSVCIRACLCIGILSVGIRRLRIHQRISRVRRLRLRTHASMRVYV